MDEDRIELRRAVPADAPAVRALARSAYAKWVPLIGREPRPMAFDYDAAIRDHRIDLLLLDGALAALVETIPGEDHLLVENLAVAPAFQGRGLAPRLMAHAERLAAEEGYAEVRLYTNQQFAENIALYRRLGFRMDREEALSAVGVAAVQVHMSKRIGPAAP